MIEELRRRLSSSRSGIDVRYRMRGAENWLTARLIAADAAGIVLTNGDEVAALPWSSVDHLTMD